MRISDWSSDVCSSDLATVGCFTPPEVMKATEKTKAAYAMLRFGCDNAMLGGVNVRGNIGVRIVRTDIDSPGSVGFPQPNVFTQLLLTPCGTPLDPAAVVNPACYLTDDRTAFAAGRGTPHNFTRPHTTFPHRKPP